VRDEIVEVTPRRHSGALLATIAVALLFGLGGTIWSYTLSNRLATQQQALTDAAAQNTKLAAALQETDARLNTEESRLEEEQVHHRRLFRRQAIREARQEPERAASVLQRQGSRAV
jgi:flagellar biosynthesis/type III secretory pathway M-ring protein FliF/YscJ